MNSLLHLCKHIRYRKYNLFCRVFSFFFCFFSVFFCLIIFLLFMAASDKSSCCANFFALICVSSGNNLSMRNFKDKEFLRILKLIMKIPNIHFRIQFFYFPFQRQHQQRHQRQLRQLLNLYSYQYVRRWLFGCPESEAQDGARLPILDSGLPFRLISGILFFRSYYFSPITSVV